MALPLFAAKAQPDEIEGPAHAYEQANQGQHAGAKELIGGEADPAPEEKPGKKVSEDRPEGVLVASVSFVVGHAAMVDEFSALDN